MPSPSAWGKGGKLRFVGARGKSTSLTSKLSFFSPLQLTIPSIIFAIEVVVHLNDYLQR
ncbi:hypothetical protein HBH56_032100 [Parastagonospora nodorum]|uniref:Uncharacterized protein n=1 Tax=Phaeosphaeria nodorum (strain SN15 / ATCC MYA-4574 / FGSC 10173) TaxID=321614 RepID=A0A7U2F7V0_PHANO|nr:hypothetical protein HBH56_032100 [Parastagonospora nodorum]QRD00353.1 hypothetical protein JI435_415120 [Parastagonospora nodorum SN15]KAH3933893.1 hypothetical protein HBH54_067350 [Parastagonospora nodorum]KAH3952532.1 hypothetical protein HBH53_042700 [Parastagonospora nodorum]KAH3980373.1 hypothetical protein HBH52_089870 [Parastagonospora nodorum]